MHDSAIQHPLGHSHALVQNGVDVHVCKLRAIEGKCDVALKAVCVVTGGSYAPGADPRAKSTPIFVGSAHSLTLKASASNGVFTGIDGRMAIGWDVARRAVQAVVRPGSRCKLSWALASLRCLSLVVQPPRVVVVADDIPIGAVVAAVSVLGQLNACHDNPSGTGPRNEGHE